MRARCCSGPPRWVKFHPERLQVVPAVHTVRAHGWGTAQSSALMSCPMGDCRLGGEEPSSSAVWYHEAYGSVQVMDASCVKCVTHWGACAIL